MGQAIADPLREEAVARRVRLRGTKIFLEHFLFSFLSSRGQVRVRFGKLLDILTPPSYHPFPPEVSHLGRVFPSFPSLPYVASPSQEVWADFVRADPLKAQDGHPLEMFRKIKGRSRIEDATPARKIERQDTTPGPAPVEQDFAGEEPEPADETSPVGSFGYRRNLRDRRTEQSTTRGIEHHPSYAPPGGAGSIRFKLIAGCGRRPKVRVQSM